MHNFTERQDIWEEAHEAGVNEGIELGREQGIELSIEQMLKGAGCKGKITYA